MSQGKIPKTLKEIVTLTDRDKDPQEGQAEKAWRATGVVPQYNQEKNELSVGIPIHQGWHDLMTAEMAESLRNQWCIDEPTLNVTYTCEMGLAEEGSLTVIPMRVAATRGNGWVDIVPSRANIVMPLPKETFGNVRVKVSVTLERSGQTFTFVDGMFSIEQDKLDTLGPNTPGRMFNVGQKCVLFVHWIARFYPAFVTVACNMNECPL